ncbi:uncharacterized protein B0I36DRAFT_112392 [Microdochium trichocladiopsis]|uniref:Short-chain dehydrogenase n=1 Tax=Microdochium trichocladiopsis TaxID=1682393 RepID=A0A9P9BMV6_9PEZI|nr:uncharacterized protein B0I36DRAFT_112392 [Microdochium trichocladiopsis]KAH7030616.1 hypothetical protein B0I36DRAFT_112392 [Microdochium trichocladiopsis]
MAANQSPPAGGTILVTGANGGLGSSVASQVVAGKVFDGTYHGLFLVRDAAKAAALNAILASATRRGGNNTVVSVDLSSLASVRAGAAQIKQLVDAGKIPPLRAMVLAAGYREVSKQTFTEDGFDATFQNNYLGEFLLVLLLLGSMDREKGRVVIVSGMNHDTEDPRNEIEGAFKDPKYKTLFHSAESLAKGTFCSFTDDPSPMSGQRRYGAAHLCEVMFMVELHTRLTSQPSALSNIKVVSYDPGAMPTQITRDDPSFMTRVVAMQFILPLLAPVLTWLWPNGYLRSKAKAARDTLFAAGVSAGGFGGAYGDGQGGVNLNGSLVWPVSKEAKDEAKRAELWRESVKWCGIKEGDTVLENWQ